MPAFIGEQEIDTKRIPDTYDTQFSFEATFLWANEATPETHAPSLVVDGGCVYAQEDSGDWWQCGVVRQLPSSAWRAAHLMTGYGSRPESPRGTYPSMIAAAWATL